MSYLSYKKKWQAEQDARTLAEYNEIISDKVRLNKALKEAQKQASELSERANALTKGIGNIKRKK